MIAYGLTIVGLILIVGGLVGRYVELKKGSRGETWWGWMMLAFGIAIIAILWISIFGLRNDYQVEITRLEVKYDFDIPNKVEAMREMIKLLSPKEKERLQQTLVVEIEGSIEKFNVGEGILKQFSSLREEVREYNDRVAELQERRKRPVWPNCLYIPKGVEKLKFVKFSELLLGIPE